MLANSVAAAVASPASQKIYVQFKIQRRRQVIDPDCLPDGGHHDSINRPFVVEFYLCFGRVNIDVDVRGVDLDKQHIKRVVRIGDGSFVGPDHGVVQVIVFDVPVVDEKVLFVPRLPGRFGLANIAVHRYVGCFFVAGGELFAVAFAKHIHDAAAQFTRYQIKHFLIVMKQREPHFRVSQSHPLKLIDDVTHLY